MFNIDQIGGMSQFLGRPIKTDAICCDTDSSGSPSTNNAASHRYTDTLARVTNTYCKGLRTVIARAYGSDYVPFMRKNYVVTGYYEYMKDLIGGSNHLAESKADTVGNCDTLYYKEVVKGCVAFTAIISGAEEVVEISNKRNDFRNVCTINSKSNGIVRFTLNKPGKVQLEYYNISGKKILTKKLGYLKSGIHSVDYKGALLSSNLLIVKIKLNGEYTKTFKLNLIK